jgi:uncharacterized protein
MKILFFLIHPAKFHQCRITINYLIAKGHKVEIIILGRDILEELVINEGWDYKIIFPRGRKWKGVNVLISAGLLFFPTIYKLYKLSKSKKYDLFLTDDLLSYVGIIRSIPTIYFTDDDFSAVPQALLYLLPATHVFAPNICYLGKFEKKVIGYYGYKSLAHLHPNNFKPDRTKLHKSLSDGKPYFFIRTVMANSKHDNGKSGIDDNLLRKIISRFEKEGKVILNSERPLPQDLLKYQLNYKKNDIAHYLYFAKLVIGDSTTMSAEAAVLGTPSIEIDDWFSDFQQYQELNGKYRLMQGFDLDDEVGVLNLLDEYLAIENLDSEFQNRRQKMLEDKIDVSAFLIWIIEFYPNSINEYKKNHDIQLKFNLNVQ